MSYDFMLFRLRDSLGPKPMPIPADLDGDAFVPIDDATPLLDALRASSLAPPARLKPTPRGWRWITPDGGQLEIGTAPPTIIINCHAHWDHVGQLFELALAAWPDVVLFDMQSAHLHDPASFRAATALNDDEARQRARRGGAAGTGA